MTTPAYDDEGTGLVHKTQPPPARPDNVQQSVTYGLDYVSGELRAYPPAQRPQEGRQS